MCIYEHYIQQPTIKESIASLDSFMVHAALIKPPNLLMIIHKYPITSLVKAGKCVQCSVRQFTLRTQNAPKGNPLPSPFLSTEKEECERQSLHSLTHQSSSAYCEVHLQIQSISASP